VIRMRMGLILWLLSVPALAADLPLDRPKSEPSAPSQSQIEPPNVFKQPDATCVSWTDGCRTCTKQAEGVVCSNVAITCTQTAVRCTQ
jgi:hypothetical protein